MGKIMLNGVEYSDGGGGTSIVYSYDEQVIGTYLDGKPLYQKTFYYSNVYAGAESQSQMTHDLSNIDTAWVHEALFKNTNVPQWSCATNGVIYSSSSKALIAWQIGSSVFYWIGDYANATADRCYLVTVRYTKTTD